MRTLVSRTSRSVLALAGLAWAAALAVPAAAQDGERLDPRFLAHEYYNYHVIPTYLALCDSPVNEGTQAGLDGQIEWIDRELSAYIETIEDAAERTAFDETFQSIPDLAAQNAPKMMDENGCPADVIFVYMLSLETIAGNEPGNFGLPDQ